MIATIKLWLLAAWRRLVVGVVGIFVLLIASAVYWKPPIRETITYDGERSRIVRTESPADSSGVTIALLTAGAVALAYGLGLKIPSFGLADSDNSQEASAQVQDVEPPSSPPHAAAAATRDTTLAGKSSDEQVAAAIDRELLQRAEYFVRVSSWNGKKVLYASYLASRSPSKIFDLRGLCRRDSRMSFDYAFGYFVASSSAGVFQHGTSADGNFLEVTQFPEIIATLLLKHIEGQLSMPLDDREKKRAEIREIANFFHSPPPTFAQ